MSESSASTLSERVARLETGMTTILHEIQALQGAFANSTRTNWGVIFAAVGLVMAVWAAAIHPLNEDMARNENNANKLAEAVLKQNEAIGSLTTGREINIDRIAKINADMERIRNEGSPITDRRLAVTEYRLDHCVATTKP